MDFSLKGIVVVNIEQISSDYAVAPQVSAADVAELASAGYVTIICNRPDGEEPGQPPAADIAAACAAAGIGFHHIPVTGMPIPAEVIAEQRRIIHGSSGPVLAYCRSGQRSVAIFEASSRN